MVSAVKVGAMSIFTVNTDEGALRSQEKGLSGVSQKDLDTAVIFSSERSL